MPICGEDKRLKGTVTDRDLVIECIAAGKDPNTMTAGEIGDGKPVTIGADHSIDEAIATMTEHKIRRLPVIDGHELMGMLAQADIASSISDDKVFASTYQDRTGTVDSFQCAITAMALPGW